MATGVPAPAVLDELRRETATHARDEHGMDEVTPEIVDKIRASIVAR